jgi:hypothetical protein
MMSSKLIYGWNLYWLITIPMTAFMLAATLQADLGNPEDVSHLISYSVRWSVPFIYFVVAASAMPVLFPGDFSRWWIRSRKYLGLVFATAMAWQGAFIFLVSSIHSDYYYSDIYYLRDELEGSSGYLFLAAMVFTSFDFGRRHVSASQWKLIHKTGIYFLWAYPFSVYWWNLFYYASPRLIDYVFYAAGFIAFALRIAAWGKKRQQSRDRLGGQTPTPLRLLGMTLSGLGLIASVSGLSWRERVSDFLLTPGWSAKLELWLPFWPFEPFIPLMLIALGTLLVTHHGTAHAVPIVSPRS